MQPHFGNPVTVAGAPLDLATAALVMVHGRGASPASILELLPVLNRPRFVALAPAATGGTWYPYSFMAERERNEPGITSALFVLESLVSDLMSRDYPAHKIVLLGFSQGACLASEFALRHPRRYGGLVAFSGGLIGPAGMQWETVTADFEGMPVFLGCSDVDSHIPASRVLETEKVFARLGAAVTRRLYPGMDHTVNDDEIEFAQSMLDDVLAAPR